MNRNVEKYKCVNDSADLAFIIARHTVAEYNIIIGNQCRIIGEILNFSFDFKILTCCIDVREK